MKIIKPSYEILTSIDRIEVLKLIERIGRTCYKSEGKITEISYGPFVEKLVKSGHEAMIEFFDIAVKFIHNRGFSHEMVRHRHCSFAQESTRYCDYSGEITVVKPYWREHHNHLRDELSQKLLYNIWKKSMEASEDSYKKLKTDGDYGMSPQACRGVLPIDVKTEIVVKANLREWRHIFKLRCSSGAHPDMRRVMIPLRDELTQKLPEIFRGC